MKVKTIDRFKKTNVDLTEFDIFIFKDFSFLSFDEVFSNLGLKVQKSTVLNSDPFDGISIGNSTSFHAPHTDATYSNEVPKYLGMYCIENSNPLDGKGLFWEISRFAEKHNNEFRTLSEIPISFSRINETGKTESYVGHIFEKENDTISIRYRYDVSVRPEIVAPISDKEFKEFYTALTKLQNYLVVGTEPLIYPYKKGDFLLFSNTRLLHGRREITGSSRKMNRFWLQPNQLN